ncbi:MAG TPA: dephospho-CoA kinase [Ignavibacteria bacterium]|nr:dephospho-CoA kinase [Ignavibacteria bacterium]
MKTLKNKLLIGITGGIGSGKTEVCRLLSKEGFKIFYTDLIAKDLYHKDKKLASKVVEEFGKDILNYKGFISLSKLKEKIFENDRNYKKINKIVHPAVIDYVIKHAYKTKDKMIIVESALLFESGLNKDMDYIILVYANKKNRLKRIMERDGSGKKEIEKIMKYQYDDKKNMENSDFVLVNNKDIDNLESQVEFLVRVLNALK